MRAMLVRVQYKDEIFDAEIACLESSLPYFVRWIRGGNSEMISMSDCSIGLFTALMNAAYERAQISQGEDEEPIKEPLNGRHA